jgi:hypothetical protein
MADAAILQRLALSFALLSTGIAVAQISTDSTAAVSPTTARVSDVYVGTAKGVYLYHAGANGGLSLVSGSPYPIGGTAIGSNRSYFFSQGLDNLHVYPVASSGAIQGQVSQVDTRIHSGSECGTAKGAVLDHTGHDVYVQLYGDPTGGDQGSCAALQSYEVSDTAALSFLGATQFATELQTGIGGHATLINLSGTGNYAYSASYDHECDLVTWQLKRESSGAMMLDTYGILKVPSTPPDWRWYPWTMTSDPTNHMAVALGAESGSFSPCGDVEHLTQLASFTVASDGTLTTSNPPDNMPAPQVNPQVLNMSASGQFLAVGGNATQFGEEGTQGTGLQVFRFNGASPIVLYSNALTSAPIDEIHWDNTDHLYAVSNSTHKLYVYAVTSTSITAAPGSPFTIPAAPNALAVVPLLCSSPGSDGVHICDPVGSSTSGSPVLVSASGKVSGTLDRMELWVDGVKRYTGRTTQLGTTVTLSAGTHRFRVFAVNTAGQKWNSVVSATLN